MDFFLKIQVYCLAFGIANIFILEIRKSVPQEKKNSFSTVPGNDCLLNPQI